MPALRLSGTINHYSQNQEKEAGCAHLTQVCYQQVNGQGHHGWIASTSGQCYTTGTAVTTPVIWNGTGGTANVTVTGCTASASFDGWHEVRFVVNTDDTLTSANGYGMQYYYMGDWAAHDIVNNTWAPYGNYAPVAEMPEDQLKEWTEKCLKDKDFLKRQIEAQELLFIHQKSTEMDEHHKGEAHTIRELRKFRKEVLKRVPEELWPEINQIIHGTLVNYKKKQRKMSRSMKLLRSWLSTAEWNYLQEHDELELPSQYEKDVTYIINRNPNQRVVRTHKGKKTHDLCITIDPKYPDGDMLLARIALLKTDEKRFLQIASHSQYVPEYVSHGVTTPPVHHPPPGTAAYWYVVIGDDWELTEGRLDPTYGGAFDCAVTGHPSELYGGNVRTDNVAIGQRKAWVWAVDLIAAFHAARKLLMERDGIEMKLYRVHADIVEDRFEFDLLEEVIPGIQMPPDYEVKPIAGIGNRANSLHTTEFKAFVWALSPLKAGLEAGCMFQDRVRLAVAHFEPIDKLRISEAAIRCLTRQEDLVPQFVRR